MKEEYTVIDFEIDTNENEKKVEETFVGTHAEYEAAIENAKQLDAEAASLGNDAYHIANLAIGDYMIDRMRSELGYKQGSKVFDKMYNRAYEDGHSEGYSGIWNAMCSYDDFITDLSSVCGTDFTQM
jgi:hypothetical protein